MFKTAYNMIGYLMTDLMPSSSVMSVNNDLYAKLSTLLGVGDTTYLQIGQQPTMEIVQVTAAANQLIYINRSRDGTLQIPHGSGSIVQFIFCPSAALDLMQQNPSVPAVTITGSDGVVVTQAATNVFQISGTPVTITSDDDSVVVAGQFPAYDLTINRKATGCC